MNTHDLILIIISVITTRAYVYVKDQWLSTKYRWSCAEKDCRFKVSTNDPKLLRVLQESHEEYLHGTSTNTTGIQGS